MQGRGLCAQIALEKRQRRPQRADSPQRDMHGVPVYQRVQSVPAQACVASAAYYDALQQGRAGVDPGLHHATQEVDFPLQQVPKRTQGRQLPAHVSGRERGPASQQAPECVRHIAQYPEVVQKRDEAELGRRQLRENTQLQAQIGRGPQGGPQHCRVQDQGGRAAKMHVLEEPAAAGLLK